MSRSHGHVSNWLRSVLFLLAAGVLGISLILLSMRSVIKTFSDISLNRLSCSKILANCRFLAFKNRPEESGLIRWKLLSAAFAPTVVGWLLQHLLVHWDDSLPIYHPGRFRYAKPFDQQETVHHPCLDTTLRP